MDANKLNDALADAIDKAIALIKELSAPTCAECADVIAELEALSAAKAVEPVAWRVMVRDSKTEWRQYALYETEKAAQSTVKKVKGDPLQVVAQPLYSNPQPAWQPIETAPKDGEKVIIWYTNQCGNGRTVFARWLTAEQASENDADDIGLECGWYECIDNWDEYTEVAIYNGEPTHWMPMPEAPKDVEK